MLKCWNTKLEPLLSARLVSLWIVALQSAVARAVVSCSTSIFHLKPMQLLSYTMESAEARAHSRTLPHQRRSRRNQQWTQLCMVLFLLLFFWQQDLPVTLNWKRIERIASWVYSLGTGRSQDTCKIPSWAQHGRLTYALGDPLHAGILAIMLF